MDMLIMSLLNFDWTYNIWKNITRNKNRNNAILRLHIQGDINFAMGRSAPYNAAPWIVPAQISFVNRADIR